MKAILRRLALIPVLAFTVATLGFFLLRAAPGGPFDQNRAPASREVEAAIRARYHLDEPLLRQYLRFSRQLLRGDLGPSLKYRNHTVNDILAQTLPVSLVLGLLAFGLAIGVGIPVGFAAAVRRGGWPDHLASILAVVGICIPVFVLGPLLVLVFGLGLRWLPVALWGSWECTVLPSAALGLFFAARVSRLMREGLLEVLGSPFIQAARAKGLSPSAVLARHAFRGAVLPVVSYSGPMLADLLTGSFIVENLFQIPGTGVFFVNSFFSRDYPMMIGLAVVYSVLLQLLNLASDLAVRGLDPRLRDA
jgi:oligopeptide transport system permease protein